MTASNGSGPGPQATVASHWVLGPVPSCTLATSNSAPENGHHDYPLGKLHQRPDELLVVGCVSTTSTCTASNPGVGASTYTVKATNGNGTRAARQRGRQLATRPPPSTGDGGVIGAASGGGGTGFSALIRDTGTLWTWGDNSRSGLGDGSATSRSTPGQVRGLTEIKAATVGERLAYACPRQIGQGVRMGRQHLRRSGQRHHDAAGAASAGRRLAAGRQGRGGGGGQRLQRRAAR